MPAKKFGSTLMTTLFLVFTQLENHSTMAKKTTVYGLVLQLIRNTFLSSQKNTSSGLMVLDTAETLFSEKNVSLSALLQFSPAKKAGLQNTCLFLSSQTHRAKLNTLQVLSHQLVEKQTSQCLFLQFLAGKLKQSAMILHG